MEAKVLTPGVLFDLGLLHDCKISALAITEARLSFELEDVHANTAGLPEYPGPQSAVVTIELRGSDRSTLAALRNVELPARIYEFEMKDGQSGVANAPYAVTLRLSPSGSFELVTDRGELLFR